MYRRLIAAWIVVIVMVAIPQSAHAGDLTATPWARAGISAAVHHWGTWPSACPSITVVAADLNEKELGKVPRIQAITASDCVIWISKVLLPVPAYNYQLMCAILVHEYGHLIGFEHPTDESTDFPRSSDPIMGEYLDETAASECKPKAVPRARVAKKKPKKLIERKELHHGV